MSDSRALFVISVAAELAGMHPQTLRTYDRLGLVSPGRSSGRGRRYSQKDIDRLREVQRLSQEEGLNLEGIRQVLALADRVSALQQEVLRLQGELRRAEAVRRGEIVPVSSEGQVMVWQRRRTT